ncbi:FxsA family protein [Ectobacillus ponti]|uniref:Membrane protein FxsA n=1 Tax=Ectobacillus ponti TaxID=2961894 RepID=A0AA41X1X3_9BACI|nr:FxsA family protein [Ectobacillus ponti]MCP8967431.1 membrane protein FxsA [Ectobacillus ponti]
MKLLVLLFILIPAVEVSLLVASSHWIGVLPTFFVIVATGVIGAYLAKRQGMEVLREIRYRLSRGQMPTESLLDGVCILVGAVLLLTPGYTTDILGFLLLFPVTRKPCKHLLSKQIEKKLRNGKTIIWR